MKKTYLLLLMAVFFSLIACVDEYDDRLIPMTGVYNASITGSFLSFDMAVTLSYGDYIQIEAPFDGYIWTLADVEVRDKDSDIKRLEINGQYLDPETYVYGEGYYSDETIQLDYYIEDPFGTQFFQIIATKF